MVLSVLRKANACRTTNFDLITEEGWAMLVSDIAEDFPHLSLAELNTIIKLGYKGKLDKYKSLPLNYTRIYQWVSSEAPKQPSAWRAKFPEILAWADMLGLSAKFSEKLIEKSTLHGLGPINGGVALTELRGIQQVNSQPAFGAKWVNGDTHGAIELLAQEFKKQYPEWSVKAGHLLY